MDQHIIVTISREYGSGGHGIGKRLAEKLGVPFYDRESIEQYANEHREQPVNTDWLSENNLRSREQSAFAGLGAFGPGIDLNTELFLRQANALWDLSKQGPCVIVGRSADFILQNRPHTYRFFISSQMQRRLRHIKSNPKDYDAATKKEARDILRMDKKRASYYNYYTGQIWGKASNYDLCIDSGKLGPRTVDFLYDFIQQCEAAYEEEN